MCSELDFIAVRLHQRLSAKGIPPSDRARYLADLAELTPEDAEGVLQGTSDPSMGALARMAQRLQTSLAELLAPVHGGLHC